jgi:prepilin-type N-terminal cleavage/methylation domain-containing protein
LKSFGSLGLLHGLACLRSAFFGAVRCIRPGVAHTPPFSGKDVQEQSKYPSTARNGFEPNRRLHSSRELKLVQGLQSVPGLKPRRRSVPNQASEYLSASTARNGFTLIEVVVTLCIVAILTAIAIPGFRKATEDFRLNATLEDTVDILKACRNYYLIFNEFPPDANWDAIPDKLRPFVPSHLMNLSTKKWNRKPLGKAAYGYDVENWMADTSHKPYTSGVSLTGIRSNTTDLEKCYRKLRSIMDERYVIKDNTNGGMICTLPECPGSTNPSSNTTWENRYY